MGQHLSLLMAKYTQDALTVNLDQTRFGEENQGCLYLLYENVFI